MAYSPSLEDTEEVIAPSAKAGGYSPSLEDTEEALPQLAQQNAPAMAAQESMPAEKPLSLWDAIKQSISHSGKNFHESYRASNALLGGIPAGTANLSDKIGARLLGEKSSSNPITSAIEDFFAKESPEYSPLVQQGEFIGENAPFLAAPGGFAGRAVEKFLPAAANRGLVGNVLRGTATGAAGGAIAAPFINPDEPLSDALEHGGGWGAALGAALPLASKAAASLPALGSRALYSVMATPENQREIAQHAYKMAIDRPEALGAKVSTLGTKERIGNILNKYDAKSSPTAQGIKKVLQEKLAALPDRLAPSDAHQWAKDFAEASRDAFKESPGSQLSAHLNSISKKMKQDLISGISKDRYIGRKKVYEGSPTAARDYRSADKFFSNRVIPARENPVSKAGLALQGAAATIMPELLGHEGLAGSALALMSPQVFHIPNPAMNVAKRMFGKAGRRELSSKTLLDKELQKRLSSLIPAILSGSQ